MRLHCVSGGRFLSLIGLSRKKGKRVFGSAYATAELHATPSLSYSHALNPAFPFCILVFPVFRLFCLRLLSFVLLLFFGCLACSLATSWALLLRAYTGVYLPSALLGPFFGIHDDGRNTKRASVL
ncbi:hypothetical protein J3F83DRAFT_747671 [Trichoderma novae-zelandiae]